MEWVALAALIIFVGFTLWLYTKGEKSGEASVAKADAKAEEKADEVSRDVDREPDPRKRLFDKWSR